MSGQTCSRSWAWTWSLHEPFTRELSQVTAYDFMLWLKRHLGLKYLLIGYDFALGKGREGNATRLTEIGSELGYRVEVVPAIEQRKWCDLLD